MKCASSPSKILLSPIVGVLALVGLSACGGAPSGAGTTEPPVPRLAPLARLVPEGADWVLVGKPRALWRTPEARRVVQALFPPPSLDRFAARTGVAPEQLDEAVMAQHGDSLLWIAEGELDAQAVVRRVGERMNGEVLSVDAPRVRRAGYLGVTRYDVTALTPRTLLVVRCPPPVVPAALAVLERGEGCSPLPPQVLGLAFSGAGAPRASSVPRGALSDAAVAPLRDLYAAAPLVLYVPRPLDLREGEGIRLLLARQRTMAAALTAAQDGEFQLQVHLRGAFPPGAAENFRQLARSLGRTGLGVAVGLDAARQSLSVVRTERSITVDLRLPARRLARGMRILFGNEIWDLLDLGAGGGRRAESDEGRASQPRTPSRRFPAPDS